MNRLELSETIMKGLVEGQLNDTVISHIKEIVIKIETHLNLNINNNSFIEEFFNYNDLAQTIRDISNEKFYYALTRLDDFLLRGKSYEQPLSSYELYIIKSFLDGILLSSEIKVAE